MKNNSKSALKIGQLISILVILVVVSTNIQLFTLVPNVIELSKNSQIIEIKNNDIKEEIQVAQSYERRQEVTTRSEVERTAKVVTEEPEEKYISISEISISRGMDITQRCGISKEDFRILMQNIRSDTSGFFERNADTIYDLCEKYEINELFFCGLMAAESGWNIASNHKSSHNYISMMSNGKLIKYATEADGLEAAAKLLHNRYLTEGGSYYYGKTISGVQRRFCPNSSTWVGLVYGCMKQIVSWNS